MSTNHFGGKSAPEHLVDARKKGALVSTEYHGRELSGAFSACIDTLKETSVLLSILILVIAPNFKVMACIMVGFLIWKIGRSAIIGWARIERLHRLIEEERFEIEHNREQEREELKEMYAAKGFKDKLLDDVVEVLMADDNRLLAVMLEEELGLPLESYQHPLHQALGAGLGVIFSAGVTILAYLTFSVMGALIATGLIVAGVSFFAAIREKNNRLKAVVWNLAVTTLSLGSIYFLKKLIF